MNNRLALAALTCSLILTACGGGGGGSDSPGATTNPAVNVAASTNGATAVASHNPTDAAKLIDGSPATTWISDDGAPIVVDFGAIKSITRITITKVSAAVVIGSDPDILVELSSNGTSYQGSNITLVTGGIPCTSSTVNTTVLTCEMAARDTRFIRITSLNGKAFEFQELEVIGRN